MTRSARYVTGIAIVALAMTRGGLATAGPGDTPLPTFSDGKPALHVYTAIGVIKNNNMETDFVCTNTGAAVVNIGVEVFDETGALRNSISAGVGAIPNVAVGRTVTIGTSGTAVLHEDATITLNLGGSGMNSLRNGSGRVVGSTKNISCTAMVLDELHDIQDPAVSSLPPPTVVNLPLTRVP